MAHLYFFFNSVGLKGGLLYTNLLTPFILIWLIKQRYVKPLIYACAALIPFSVLHCIYGVDLKSFLISHALFISTIIFVIAAYLYVSRYHDLKAVFKQIIVFNFVLVIIAIPFYFMDYSYQKLFWYTNLFTSHKLYTRLALFTYEASYYSLLLVPVCYYYYFKIILKLQFIQGRFMLLIISLPLLLSMSFGVIGGTLVTALLMAWLNRNSLLKYRIPVMIISFLFIASVILLFVLFAFFSDTLLVKRISNIFIGTDTSTNGRTFESFQIAWKTIHLKSTWFGCGLGQVKLLIPKIIRTYFQHWGAVEVYRIPNAVAETLAIFGVFGLIVRFGLIFYFFVKGKVRYNYFQMALFIFIFIYQFTGSYITNIVEYVIWIFAFTPVFSEFNKQTDALTINKNDRAS